MKTVGELGEAGLLKLIEDRFVSGAPHVERGIGDDAAVLKEAVGRSILTADMLVEGVDFDFAWAGWADVGHKAVAVNLSDIAAMGAEPRGLLLSLGLRPTDLLSDVEQLVSAFAEFGSSLGAPLLGGDLSSTDGPLVVSVTAVGEASANDVLYRYRGRAGERILVTGELGGAAAGLLQLFSGQTTRGPLIERQLRPEPRVAVGRTVAKSGLVSSCADVSDGLAADVLHIVEPGAGALIELDRLPIAKGVREVCERHERDPAELALSGGEDFELVMTAAEVHVADLKSLVRELGAELTDVGVVVDRPGVRYVGDLDSESVKGFEHFVS